MDSNPICDKCAYKIIAGKNHNVPSLGNINCGSFIILPNTGFDRDLSKSESVQMINEAHRQLYGVDVWERYYITALVRCPTDKTFPINSDIYMRCYEHLRKDLLEGKPRKFMMFGQAAAKLLGIYPNRNRQIVREPIGSISIVNYNPAIIRYEGMKDVFVRKLIDGFQLLYNL